MVRIPLFILAAALLAPAAARADVVLTPEMTAEEAARLKEEGAAKRENGALVLTIAGGKTVIRRDRTACDDGQTDDRRHCVHYLFAGHFSERHAFLIKVQYPGDYSYEWIDGQTGEVTELAGEPEFSPSRSRFVIVRVGQNGGFDGIQVWACLDKKPVKEWEYHPPASVVYTFERWESEDAVRLSSAVMRNDGYKPGPQARLTRLRSGASIVRVSDGHGAVVGNVREHGQKAPELAENVSKLHGAGSAASVVRLAHACARSLDTVAPDGCF